MPDLVTVDLDRNTDMELHLARRVIERQADSDMLLEMLGFTPYESGDAGKWRRTIGEQPPGDAHGKRSTWVAYKCCELCRQADRAYHDEINAKRRAKRAEARRMRERGNGGERLREADRDAA